MERALAHSTTADPAASPRKLHALALFAGLPGRYDRIGAIMSFGQDRRWRRAMVAAVGPRPGERVLDVATGTGLVACELVRQGGCEVVGLDQSERMLGGRPCATGGRAAAGRAGRLRPGRGGAPSVRRWRFDALTFTYLLRYVDDRAATMRELARVIRPGGRIGMVEFGMPSRPALRGAWRTYTRFGLPLIGRLASPAWYEVGRFLGPSVEELQRSEADLQALWRAAGIADVHERRMSFGAGLVMWGTRDATDAAGAAPAR